jgi:outer membrane protein assembly factor BamD
MTRWQRLSIRVLAAALCAVALTGCSRRVGVPSAGSQDADRFLFDRGMEALYLGDWLVAREYLQRLFDTYPQSPYRPDAKLGIGDTYLGEGRPDSYVLAANEFSEYLRFYPLSVRADYAQYRLAETQVRQMLNPERDQTATREALRVLDTFTNTYGASPMIQEALRLQRQARDRLSDHELRVGMTYLRSRWSPGAIARLEPLLSADPSYSRRDAVYFYLAEAYRTVDATSPALRDVRTARKDMAVTLYQKLLAEYDVSEHLEEARRRIAEIQLLPPPPATSATSPPNPQTPGTTPAPPVVPGTSSVEPVITPPPSPPPPAPVPPRSMP